MSSYTVNVSGLASTTTDVQLHNFFTFCGKISQIEHEKDKAIIHFEKPNAAKTALMLNGGTLDGSVLAITSENTYKDEEGVSQDETHLEQHEKPRAGIAAEYLAHGYILSHKALERAIEIDNEQGISKRFLEYFHHVDKSLGSRTLGPDQTISNKVQSTVDAATQKAKTLDEQKGYSKTAYDFYSKAIASPLGQKVRSFYTTTSKRVQDIHEEARRIAEQHKATSGGAAPGEKPEAAAASEPTQTK
ncbi:Protein vip1 [Termitomyces sp. T112]|nr:hypothetical protein C0989_011354 [Termitomyces sp. Mn162]KAG5733331.1 Protein vip1 [Termitomyces sp. T112]KAH0586129.1 hypothetical protein H2248_007395 [Termitomyces sp. 'cryptogamus']KNZ73027.1 Protein vip1 [Termitomyces sp. J132]